MHLPDLFPDYHLHGASVGEAYDVDAFGGRLQLSSVGRVVGYGSCFLVDCEGRNAIRLATNLCLTGVDDLSCRAVDKQGHGAQLVVLLACEDALRLARLRVLRQVEAEGVFIVLVGLDLFRQAAFDVEFAGGDEGPDRIPALQRASFSAPVPPPLSAPPRWSF